MMSLGEVLRGWEKGLKKLATHLSKDLEGHSPRLSNGRKKSSEGKRICRCFSRKDVSHSLFPFIRVVSNPDLHSLLSSEAHGYNDEFHCPCLGGLMNWSLRTGVKIVDVLSLSVAWWNNRSTSRIK